MNWDWEKLQDRRQKQPPPQQQGDDSGDFDKFVGNNINRLQKLQFPWGKIAIGLVVILWGLSGIFTIAPDEVGVVLRFGKFVRIVDPGPHYRWPFPIETVYSPKVTAVQRVEVGYTSSDPSFSSSSSSGMDEASMLTKDENIVFVQFVVQFQIDKDHPEYFLFSLADPITTIKSAAQASMREVIGQTQIDAALTSGRAEIEASTRELLQSILNSYKAGVTILGVEMQDVHPPKDVLDAFKDVASAREDKVRIENQAEAYSNEILPRARGLAAQTVNEAEAYSQSVVLKAQGESQRFLSVLLEYNKAKDITAKRMYLETMQEILSSPGLEKVILPDGKATAPVLPYLPLEQRSPQRQGAPSATPAQK